MKKIVAFIALAAIISACSQYTCPTYAKKAPKKNSEQKIWFWYLFFFYPTSTVDTIAPRNLLGKLLLLGY